MNRIFMALLAAVCALTCAGCAANENTASKPDDGQQIESQSQAQQPHQGPESQEEEDAAQLPEEAYLSCEEALALIEEGGVYVMDTRVLSAYDQVHVEGAVSMPASVVDIRIREVPTDQTVIMYAQQEERLGEVWAVLESNGISPDNIKVIEGGMDSWAALDLPVVAEPHIGC